MLTIKQLERIRLDFGNVSDRHVLAHHGAALLAELDRVNAEKRSGLDARAEPVRGPGRGERKIDPTSIITWWRTPPPDALAEDKA